MQDLFLAADTCIKELEAELLPAQPREGRFWAYHPLALREWGTGVELARDTLIAERHCWSGEETYFEVGCGIGTKMRLARAMGWLVHGIEIHEPCAALARRLSLDVVCADAFDWTDYDADLVYLFRLCVADDAEAALTKHVAAHMRRGALLFHVGGPEPEGLEHVGESVWRVG